MAYFIFLPALQLSLLEKACKDSRTCDPTKAYPADVSKTGALQYQWILAAIMGVPVLSSMGLTGASDRYGRRRILLFSSLMSTPIFIGMLVVHHWSLNPYIMIPFNAISGIGGGMATLIAVTIASIADVTTEAERGLYVSLVMGSLYLGGTIGPMLGGHVTALLGMGFTFWLCLSLSLLQCLLVVFCFRETAADSSNSLHSKESVTDTDEKTTDTLSLYDLTVGTLIWLFSNSGDQPPLPPNCLSVSNLS